MVVGGCLRVEEGSLTPFLLATLNAHTVLLIFRVWTTAVMVRYAEKALYTQIHFKKVY